MAKRKLAVFWMALAFLAVGCSGCAVVGTAISAGISYAIYRATK